MNNSSKFDLCGSLCGSIGLALVLLFLHGMNSSAASLVFEDFRQPEGDQGVVSTDLPILLSEETSQPVVVEFEVIPGSASVSEDFEQSQGHLVFVPGSLTPGLPRPEHSKDRLIRTIGLEIGFGLDVLAELDRPVGLAFAPPGSVFGEDLFAGYLDQNGIGVSDYVVRINYRGEVKDFARLLPEADPTSLEFAPAGSLYGDFLYLSANNRDGERPGDQGGTVQRVDVDGNVIDFSAVGVPLGPGEPGELVFGMGTDFGDLLFLANSVGSPGDILVVRPEGTVGVVVDDGLFEDRDLGLAARSIGIDTQGDYGHLIYFGEFGRRCSCIKKLYPDGRVEAWIDGLPGDPHSIAFAPPGVFEGSMFVAVDDGVSASILRVLPNGEYTVFVDGLQGFLNGNGKDVMEFSREDSVMYVADYFADRIYRIAPSTNLSVSVVGDRLPEPNETVLIQFRNPVNGILPTRDLVVTIENDDVGDLAPLLVIDSEIKLLEDSGPQHWSFEAMDDVTSLERMKVDVEVGDPPLLSVRDLRVVSSLNGFQVTLDPGHDEFGGTSMKISLTDESGNTVEETVDIVIEAVNDPPTLNPIDGVRVPFDASGVEVLFDGVGSGAVNEMDELSVGVSVRGDGFEPDTMIRYDSPDRSGSVFLSMEGRGPDVREVFVDVKVDDGGAFQNEVIRQFSLVFDEPPEEIDLLPTIEITSPTPWQIVAPDPLSFPLAATIPIEVTAFDDQGVSRVELFANRESIGVLEMEPFRFEWEEVPVGDYQISAVAYDLAGQFSRSNDLSIAVAEMSGSVAIVRNHDQEEIDKIVQYLFEMGFDSDLFWVSELEPSRLSSYDLVIWHQVVSESVSLSPESLGDLLDHFDSGIPFYFIGGGNVMVGAELSETEQGTWESLTGLSPTLAVSVTGERLHRVTDAAADELVRGRYGTIAGKSLMLSLASESGFGENGFAIVQNNERPSMIVSPYPTHLEALSRTRMANQVFRVCDSSSADVSKSLKMLFQNTVCWLMRCPTCNAVDLELIRILDLGELINDGELPFGARVKHSGECEGSAIVVTVSIPDGLELVDFSTDRGRGVVEGGALKFYLGRMPSAAEAQLEWRLKPMELGLFSVRAQLTSNNREVTDVNNELIWVSEQGAQSVASIQVRTVENGSVELQVLGEAGTSYEIYHSSDLLNWNLFGTQLPYFWEPLENSMGVDENFYRLEPEGP
jgi:hypothetical protein